MNLVQRAKSEHAKYKSAQRRTGGGLNEVSLNATTEAILETAPQVFESLAAVVDDDCVVEKNTQDSSVRDCCSASTTVELSKKTFKCPAQQGTSFLDIKIRHVEEEHTARMALIEKEKEWKAEEHDMRMSIYMKINQNLDKDSNECTSYMQFLSEM